MYPSSPITLLSLDVRNILRSQLTIQTLPDAIRECLENSIDSNADDIECIVDIIKMKFMILDNGNGISPESLEVVGNRFYTSKMESLGDLSAIKTYGFRGEAIHSLSTISNITLISKASGYNSPFAIKFSKGARTLSRPVRIDANNSYIDDHFGKIDLDFITTSGTIIICTGLFGNIPVRRHNLSKHSELKVVNDIRRIVHDLAMSHGNRNFKIRHNNNIICCIKGLNNNYMPRVFESIYGRSICSNFHTIDQTYNHFSLHGIVGASLCYSSEFQFIYLNNRRVLDTSLFRDIKNLFKSSNYFKDSLFQQNPLPPSSCSKASKIAKPQAAFNNKTTLRFPVFIIKIFGPLSIADLLQDPSKILYTSDSVNTVRKLILKSFDSFLSPHLGNKLEETNLNKIFGAKSLEVLPQKIGLRSIKTLLGSSMKVGKVNDFELSGRMSCCGMNNQENIFLINTPEGSSVAGGNRGSQGLRKIDTFNLSKHVDSAKTKNNIENSDYFDKFSNVKLSKESLNTFKVISQIDNKFILVKSELGKNKLPMLLILDQHACDERIKVEKNFEELINDIFLNINNDFRVMGEELIPHMNIELSTYEIKLIENYKDIFATWGLQFIISNTEITITHLPKLLLERKDLSFVKKLLLQHSFDILERRKLQNYEFLTKEFEKCNNWWQWIPLLPDIIIDAINSKSCRSAVMFGDPLSIIECEILIQKLSTCKFPFQCAHGRPSIIPLGDLSIHIQ